jgi:hypothetical protein
MGGMENSNDALAACGGGSDLALYRLGSDDSPVRRFIASTPETRQICNDPAVVGIRYTDAMEAACAVCLKGLVQDGGVQMDESRTVVLHVLRGGLNYGLRGALAQAFGWNTHSSAFISAQRAVPPGGDPEDWYITENDYSKLKIPNEADIVFGDVVATGTSLLYALHCLLEEAQKQGTAIRSILFFTIGGVRSEEILQEIDGVCRERFAGYQGAAVVYLEGRFLVADNDTALRISISGTDLLRGGSLMAPEFIESQYESPSSPIERCTIYDAGSRAFWLPEYIEDVMEYWQQIATLAAEGVTYGELLAERFPELDASRFGDIDLATLCAERLAVLGR